MPDMVMILLEQTGARSPSAADPLVLKRLETELNSFVAMELDW
jgi:hypothetical protein